VWHTLTMPCSCLSGRILLRCHPTPRTIEISVSAADVAAIGSNETYIQLERKGSLLEPLRGCRRLAPCYLNTEFCNTRRRHKNENDRHDTRFVDLAAVLALLALVAAAYGVIRFDTAAPKIATSCPVKRSDGDAGPMG
jgi:hypothetical protein